MGESNLYSRPVYLFCQTCGDRAWIDEDHMKHGSNTDVDSVTIQGINIIHEFITPQEEAALTTVIDTHKPWTESQEGRRKQDYGPKVSFLKRKAAVGNFGGFPDFAVRLFERMKANHEQLFDGFVPVEFCILEYTPERASYIRPHYDDMWVWGDRLITINLCSDTILRLSKEFRIPPFEVAIRMPARSLLVLSAEARYDWHHSINSYDIKSRRIAMTWREFSEEIMRDPEQADFVQEVLAIADQIDAPPRGVL